MQLCVPELFQIAFPSAIGLLRCGSRGSRACCVRSSFFSRSCALHASRSALSSISRAFSCSKFDTHFSSLVAALNSENGSGPRYHENRVLMFPIVALLF